MTGRQPAPAGFTDMTPRDAVTYLGDAHNRHATEYGCESLAWWQCPMFAIVRLRGVGHTVYVITDMTDPNRIRYRIVDETTDGPLRALGAWISDPIDSWGDAILRATRHLITSDGEIADTLDPYQRAAVAWTAPGADWGDDT